MTFSRVVQTEIRHPFTEPYKRNNKTNKTQPDRFPEQNKNMPPCAPPIHSLHLTKQYTNNNNAKLLNRVGFWRLAPLQDSQRATGEDPLSIYGLRSLGSHEPPGTSVSPSVFPNKRSPSALLHQITTLNTANLKIT